MIARHSHEQSNNGEGVEVVVNTECEDPVHGKGRYTEKRIHLNRLLFYMILLTCFKLIQLKFQPVTLLGPVYATEMVLFAREVLELFSIHHD